MPTNYGVFVGINYIGTPYQLRGCANDIMLTSKLFQDRGYLKPENIVMLSDDPIVPNAKAPTKKNILEAIKTAAKTAKPGDTIFFHYSGHGSSQRDRRFHSDEVDGKDEVLCAIDEDIVDDQLYDEFVKIVPRGVKVVFLPDCCHSGSMLDLYNNVDGPQTRRGDNPNHGYVVEFSGCRDDQTSADASYDKNKSASKQKRERKNISDVSKEKRYNGAFTDTFLTIANQKGLNYILDILWSNSLKRMAALKDEFDAHLEAGGYDQRPNIAFEGTLPDILYSYASRTAVNGRDAYPLRQTKARAAIGYTTDVVSRDYIREAEENVRSKRMAAR